MEGPVAAHEAGACIFEERGQGVKSGNYVAEPLLTMPAFDSTDTLAQNVAPPLDEPSDVRGARMVREAQALEHSRRIDAEIKARKVALKKKPPVRVLVLGQSESGKTTTIKNFQMAYARQAWIQERLSWRPVIYLNLVRSINHVTALLNSDSLAREGPARTFTLSGHHRILLLRLGPIRQIQEILERLLGSNAISVRMGAGSAARQDRARRSGYREPVTFSEISILSQSGWKSILDSVERSRNSSPPSPCSKRKHGHPVDEVSELLASCKEDIKALWTDDTVQAVLAHNRVKLDDSSGFFLNDVDRIASRGYEPSDEDIVRARLRTVGVQEYNFCLDTDGGPQTEWIMYDVAGWRTQRAAWVPYFADVTAILFLAPISAFDERLAEDRRINRLQDTYMLWRVACECKLLSGAQIILFMNKCDLLAKKLKEDGIKVRDYIVDFGNKPNDFKTVTNFFHQAFKSIFYGGSKVERRLYSHFTSVVDTKATALTLYGVQESILRRHISNAGLL